MNDIFIVFSPRWENDTVADMTVDIKFDSSLISPDGPSLDYASQGWNGLCPFPEHDRLVVEDSQGDVPFELKDAPSQMGGVDYLGMYFNRLVNGTIHVSYRLFPRILPEGYRSSPYYDFRNEPFGLNGSTLFSLILPKTDEVMHVHFSWDMSAMPEGTRGILSIGEGDIDAELNTWGLRFILYTVGVMDCYEEGKFGVYWFGTPNFEVIPTAKKLGKIFLYMKDFFRDPDPSFRVFLRRDPFEKSNGGSACPHAFISGYSEYGGMDPQFWYSVLVHEMTHSWTLIDDTNVGTATWFLEGATEYYSTILPLRAGLSDEETTLAAINNKATERYYNNVYREMPNMEIPKIQWKDRRAQTVPYGRGFVYLANVDAQIRRAGRGSLDDLVIGHSVSNMITLEEVEEFINSRLGEKGMKEYEDMKAGKLLVPDPDIFGSQFRTVRDTITLDGKDAVSYHWELAR